MGATPSQQQAISTLRKPLFIQAGAGTGKTFTLTKRLGHGLAAESGPAIPGVENLLTITFTNKAAGELLGRVRAELRERGLHQAALQVDSAWISTIHAMCKKILTEHCFEAGIDVGAALLSEEQSNELFYQALGEYLQQHAGDAQLKGLLAACGSAGACQLVAELALNHLQFVTASDIFASPSTTGEASMSSAPPAVILSEASVSSAPPAVILSEASMSSAPPAVILSEASVSERSRRISRERAAEACVSRKVCLDLGPAAPAFSVARPLELAAALRTAYDDLVALGAPDTATCAKKMDALAQSFGRLEEFAASPAVASSSWAAYAELLEGCVFTTCGNVKKQFKAILSGAAEAMAAARMQAGACAASEAMTAAVQVAQCVLGRFAQLKRAQGCIDTNDLLTQAYRLLVNHPEIASVYRERFAAVMVDEFQDTDALQVGIIGQLVREGLETLCTVGDAQQSIYGFRGADLEVYRSMRSRMRAAGGVEVSLDVNFRSHPAILQFVEAIFASPQFFGGEFLCVKPGPANASVPAWHAEGDPRVRVLLAAGTKAEQGRGHTSAEALRHAGAENLAQAFAAYHKAGAAWRDMAVLMGTTSQAGIYLAALRAHGIPCVMQGGSSFYTEPEVVVCSQLCRVLENPADDDALFNVLASPLFGVSDDELLALSVVGKQLLKTGAGDLRVRVSLFDALEYAAAHGEELEATLGFPPLGQTGHAAHAVLKQALALLERQPLASVVAWAVQHSAWPPRLAAQGLAGAAVQANIDRVCDVLADYARLSGASVVGAAEHLRSLVEAAAEKTGGRSRVGEMVSPGADVVKVMTIHASKGLEFPIVAVAEFERAATPHRLQLAALTENGVKYLGLPRFMGERARTAFSSFDPELSSLAAAHSPESYVAGLGALHAEREAAEEQRLLYVALTRARDTLLVLAHDGTFGSTGELGKGLFKQVADQLFGEQFPNDGEVVAVSTGALVGVSVTTVSYEEQVPAGSPAAPSPLAPPERGSAEVPAGSPVLEYSLPHSRALASYSSLAAQPHVLPLSRGTAARMRTSLLAPSNRGSAEAPAGSPAAATLFGTAFHECAQWLAGSRATATPEQLAAQATRAAARHALPPNELARLQAALAAWHASDLFAEVKRYECVFPEYPFVVMSAEGVPLEGFIDLLCVAPGSPEALVVDYKTGTSGAGDAQALRQRYQTQAECYAQAVRALGVAERVKLVFVRPEASMEQVVYGL